MRNSELNDEFNRADYEYEKLVFEPERDEPSAILAERTALIDRAKEIERQSDELLTKFMFLKGMEAWRNLKAECPRRMQIRDPKFAVNDERPEPLRSAGDIVSETFDRCARFGWDRRVDHKTFRINFRPRTIPWEETKIKDWGGMLP